MNAVDYLLKPVSRRPLRAPPSSARASRVLAHQPLPVAEVLAEARARRARHARPDPGSAGAEVHVIPAGALDYAVARDDYVGLHVARARST